MCLFLSDPVLQDSGDIFKSDPALIIYAIEQWLHIVYDALLVDDLLYPLVHAYEVLEGNALLFPQHFV